MLFTSGNTDDFEFHDSYVCGIKEDNGDISFDISALNIRSTAPQNPYFTDMELSDTVLTFENARVDSLCTDISWETDENGELLTKFNKENSLTGEKAKTELLNNLNEFSVCDFETSERNGLIVAEFTANSGSAPFFTFTLSFSTFKAEWEKYKGKAWYKNIYEYKKQAAVSINGQIQTKEIKLIFNDENDVPLRGAMLEYGDKEYYGKDDMLANAINALFKKLPPEVKLVSCLSCRYGNFCHTTQNADNEIFCLSDVEVHNQNDLFFYTEDDNERKKRRRALLFCCEKFQPIDKDYFTYNDFGL